MATIESPSESASPGRYRFEQFRLIAEERLLFCDGLLISIPPRAFDVLVVLVQRAGHLVTKDELIRRVWAGAVVEEANLGVAVSALRRAIGHHHIETVPKYGYRFRTPVEPLDEATPLTPPPTASVDNPRTSRRWRTTPPLLFVCFLGLLGWWSMQRRGASVDVATAIAGDPAQLQRLTDTFATESNPSLSSRGRLIFMSNRDGDPEIYTAAADGGDVERLTRYPGVDDYPVWSPDGTLVAFASDRGGDGLQIYIMGADGSNVRRVTALRLSCIEPGWSPDGRRLVFQRNDEPDIGQDIYTIAIDGTDLRRITARRAPDVTPAWSPDGRLIAFASNDGSGSDLDIYVVPASGGEPRRLTSDPGADIHPAWSPDGTEIAFASNRLGGWEQIYLMQADGSNPHRVLAGAGTQPSWTSDGTEVLLTSTRAGNPEVFRLALEPATNLTVHKASDTFAAWSPDGTSIAFTSNRDGKLALYTTDVARRRVEKLTDGTANDWFPSWSPDGRRLVFQTDRAGSGGLDLCVFEITSRATRCITSGRGINASPAWSPDGRRIAFASNMDGGPYQLDIYTIAPDGSDLRRLTSHLAYECDPAWSPDSSRLAFTSAREGSFDVFTINADGSNERRLTFNNSADGGAWWSPDGRRIVFSSDRAKPKRHELYMMPADGGDAVRVTRRSGTWPRWNPRDNRIIFTSTSNGNEEVLLVEVPPLVTRMP